MAGQSMDTSSGPGSSGGGGGGSASMISAFTELGDKLHKNFSANLNSAIQYKQQDRQMNMQEDQMMFGRTKSMMDELQRRREALFGRNMTERGMRMSEQEAALRNRADEYQLRKTIENDKDKEVMTKNFMVGMMNSLGGRGEAV